ncbi:MAG: GspH/FimT family pseudopilin [bacterium]
MAWTTLGKRPRSAAGFSLPEFMITVAMFMTVAGITGVSFSTSMRAMKGTAAMQQVVSQIRLARNMAISQQHSIELQFIPPNEIRTIRWEFPNGETTLNQYFLEGNAQFCFSTTVPDTPDGFGLLGTNSFAGQTARFLPNGRFADAVGAVTSGNLFVAVPGQPQSQRAVTIFGGTGRVSGYNWNGTEWLAN